MERKSNTKCEKLIDLNLNCEQSLLGKVSSRVFNALIDRLLEAKYLIPKTRQV